MQFVFLALLGIVAGQESSSDILKVFATANNLFTADVYREVSKSKSDNFLVCPLSTEIILSLVHAGAGGQTAQEISTALHCSDDKEKIEQSIKELTPLLQSNTKYKLNAANKIYVQEGYKIKEQFKNSAINVFNADIQNIQFGKRQEAASEMNKWVEEHTENQIKDIINPSTLKNDTRAVLINAMHFHAAWASPFHTEVTQKRPFYLNGKDQVEVDMMYQQSTFKYYASAELNAQFLEMPYVGKNSTMTFVLPNDKEGLAALEGRGKDVFVVPTYEHRQLKATIPKFKFETQINLNKVLQNLGILQAFGDEADFNDIVIDESLKIGEVVQKTFIEVDEKGTTAAAATHLRLPQLGVPFINPVEFIADRPFIFFIKINNVILFAGRYTSPTH